MDESAQPDLPLRRAVVLGLIQGPAELLPISSSAHINLVPWLRGWDYADLDPELRKSFEVALHAGTAVALLIGQRELLREELRSLDGRAVWVLALSFMPAAVVGYRLERPIERHLGGPGSIAAGLILGAFAMALADRHACRDAARPPGGDPASLGRGRGEAGPADGLALGIAQSLALVPGVSRNGATLTAARLRGFSRDQANLLSRIVALPIIAGATLLKTVRLMRRGLMPGQGRVIAAGTAASFLSTLASQRLIGLVERDRALWPYAAYRTGLAVVILRRLRRS